MLSNKAQHWHDGLLFRIAFWIIAEILLNCAGFDDLADYSEFLFEKPIPVKTQHFTVN